MWPEHLSECFDLDSLRSFGGFDEDESWEFFQELAEAFLDDSPARIQTILSSIPSGSFDVVKNEAHSLKGSSRNLYAVKLGDLCEALESASGNSDANSAGRAAQALAYEFARVENALNKMLEPA